MTSIIAIDQSTSATKAMLFDENAHILASDSLPHEQIFPQSGWVEHDAEEIYQNLLEVLSRLKQGHRERFEDALFLSITNQRETIVVFDAQTGKPLVNAIVWQDRRGESICAELRGTDVGEKVQQKTGLLIDTYFPASKLTWLCRNNPDLGAKLRSGEALIGTIDTYLIYRLTKGKSYVTDHTNASRTLFYDIDSLSWDPGLSLTFGLEFARLPEIRESASVFGETDLEGLVSKPLKIAGVMGDSQAALFAERCYYPGMAKVTFGTGSSIMMNIGNRRIASENGLVNAVAWVLDGKPTYGLEGITNFTGATISWLQNQLGLIDSPQESQQLAESVPDNGGVTLVPSFVGLGAPYWKAEVTGAVFGLSPSVRKEHLVRAALEGIALTITDVLNIMKQDTGIPLTRLHADGGAVRNRFLMQFTSDINQLELYVSSLPELSALGAVFSGGLATGLYSGLEALEAIDTGVQVFKPAMAADQIESLYAGWNDAIRRLLA